MQRYIVVLFFFILTVTTGTAFGAERSFNELKLNDGETISIHMRPALSPDVRIVSGRANRVPGSDTGGVRGRGPLLEMDISSRFFSAQVLGKPLITFSGARKGSISGIQGEYWGTPDKPAVYINRDIELTLVGSADCVVILVNPLARASIHTRNLRSNKIVIINNAQTIITGPGKKQVQFITQKQEVQTVVSSGWDNGTEKLPVTSASDAAPQQTPPTPQPSTTP